MLNRIRDQPMCRTPQRATFRIVHVRALLLLPFSLFPDFEIDIRAYLFVATSTLGLLGYPHFFDCIGITYKVRTKSNIFLYCTD